MSDLARRFDTSSFSISAHSAGISWLQPVRQAAAAAGLAVAEVVAAAPDERSEALAAEAAAQPFGAEAQRSAVAAGALVSSSVAPDAAAVAVAEQIAAAARPVEFAAAAARPPELASMQLWQVWVVEAAEVESRLAFAPYPK